MYIKDLPSNAAKVNSMNLEKLNFGLSLKNNMYCTVKINKSWCNKTLCNVSMPVHKVQKLMDADENGESLCIHVKI